MKNLIVFLIVLYQKTLSPDHGFFSSRHPYGFCRYCPSCSEYIKQSIEKYGLFRGCFQGIGRVLRCNPFSKGGIDLA